MKLSRILVPHRKDCFMKAELRPFSGLPDREKPYFFGNYAANEKAKIGAYHVWIRCVCNDPKCPAIKAVHSSVLSNA